MCVENASVRNNSQRVPRFIDGITTFKAICRSWVKFRLRADLTLRRPENVCTCVSNLVDRRNVKLPRIYNILM